MPKQFDACMHSGGKIRTVSHGVTYMRVCFKGGKSYGGYVHHKKMQAHPHSSVRKNTPIHHKSVIPPRRK